MFKRPTENGLPMSQQYAFTITMVNSVRRYPAEEQYAKYARKVEEIVRTEFRNCRLTMIAELTKTFDLHFHGTISYTMQSLRKNQNMPRYFRDRLRERHPVGFVLLKTMDDEPGWVEYLNKSKDEFESDLGVSHTICDDHKILRNYALIDKDVPT